MESKLFIFDTNILISAVLFKHSNPRKAFDAATSSGRIAASGATLEEFKEVLLRPKFDKYVSIESRLSIMKQFEELITLSEISVSVQDCRDPKDNKFLELAVSTNASFLVTGDKDLLVLHPFRVFPF